MRQLVAVPTLRHTHLANSRNRLIPVILVAFGAMLACPAVSAQTLAAPVDLATESSATDDLALEPYSVFVAHQKMYARCGPSEEYYRTDPLRLGQHLDVYAETDDGWLGIRPPEGSFCWIPADTVQLDATQDSGTIIEDRTVAWIGTHLGRARSYRWQVQLAKGEPITVIGRSEREGPDGPQLWLRIVPPSGEYRWVHREQVVFTSEELVAALQAEATAEATSEATADLVATPPMTSNPNRPQSTDPSIAQAGRSVLTPTYPIGSGLKPELRSRTEPTTAVEAMQQGGLLASVEFLGQPRLLEIGSGPVAPQPSSSPGDENWVAGPRGNSSNRTTSDWATTRASSLGTVMQVSSEQVTPPKQAVVSAQRIAQIDAEVQNANFDQLSLIFSRLIAGQATAAEIEPVQRAAIELAASALDAVVAGRARLLAERAQQYRRVATRRDGDSVIRSESPPVVAPANYNTPLSTNPLASPSLPPPQAPSPQGSTHSGYLVQVYSARRDSPPFALTDDTGRTIAYATPMPGVNLRTHLNSQVTLTGKSGFLTGLNTPHLMVTEAVRTPE